MPAVLSATTFRTKEIPASGLFLYEFTSFSSARHKLKLLQKNSTDVIGVARVTSLHWSTVTECDGLARRTSFVITKETLMFLVTAIFAALAFVFVKLGMYLVWMTMLANGLKIALVIIVVLCLALVWRRFFPKKTS
jgi:hypothetical protein